jgi:hypothetical protein
MSEFEKAASEPRRGLVTEVWAFLRETKKWWLVPIIVTLLLITLLVYVSSSAAAPFIYTLF